MPRPRAKIVTFRVSTAENPTPWETLTAAHDAAEAWRISLVAAGDSWATPGPPPDAGPYDQYQGKMSGVYISLMTPSVPDPDDTERINYVGEDWFGPP